MKDYELTVLIHPDLEMNVDPALDKVKKIIEQAGGKINSQEDDGKKRLAYPIKGQDFALYYYYNISLPATAPAKLSATFNIADEILRYLLVRVDEHKAKLIANRQDKEPAEEEAPEVKSTEETK